MTQTSSLATSLDVLRHRSAAWRSVYDALVARLRLLGVGASAPGKGERFPNIRLPDAEGVYRSIEQLSHGGPLVLSFNRGRWCPYCRAELEHWRTVLPALMAEGARFAVITPEVGGTARALADLAGPDIPVLCDVDNELALALGLAFTPETTSSPSIKRAGGTFRLSTAMTARSCPCRQPFSSPATG